MFGKRAELSVDISIFSISHFLQIFCKQSLTNQVLPIGLIQFILPTTDLLCGTPPHPPLSYAPARTEEEEILFRVPNVVSLDSWKKPSSYGSPNEAYFTFRIRSCGYFDKNIPNFLRIYSNLYKTVNNENCVFT